MGAVRWCEAAGARCQHKPVQMWPGDRAGSSFLPYLLEGLASVCRVLNLLSRLAARWLCSSTQKRQKVVFHKFGTRRLHRYKERPLK